MHDEIDIPEMINDLLEAVADVFPEAYQKSKEALLRTGFMRVIKEHIE